MTVLTDVLEWFEAWSHQADSFRPIPVNRWPELKEVAAAARRVVAEAPEVWWCEEHQNTGSDVQCFASHWLELRDVSDKRKFPCRMVRRLLVDPGDDT